MQIESYINLYWYNSRWYDSSVGRWIQPDTDVPESQGVQAFDRYAYVNNSPINFRDPSGHSAECGMGESGCQAGSLSATQMVFERHQWLVRQVGAGNMNDLEALAQLSDYAATLTPGCTECYVENLGATLTGHTGNSYANELLIQGEQWLDNKGIKLETGASYSSYYRQIRGSSELMQGGYDSIFQDQGTGGGNQAHHYWFYVQVGYESGMFTSTGGNFLHETLLANYQAGRSYQDFALGVEGAILGQMLSWGSLNPEDVGDYIRDTLSPGSQEAEFWDGPR